MTDKTITDSSAVRLSLRRQSLKELTAADLAGVAGGQLQSYLQCTGTCWR